MAPSTDEFRKIAEEAERNLNTYEAKTGAGRGTASDEAGVDPSVEQRFPGAEVKYGEDLSTNAGYNKRIPPQEGGELDDRGRQTRGEHFEGVGGPEDKLERQMRDFGGSDRVDPADKQGREGQRSGEYELESAFERPDARRGEVMLEGLEATRANLESSSRVPHKEQFHGAVYDAAREEVPGEMSAEGYEAPDSVVEASRESERWNR